MRFLKNILNCIDDNDVKVVKELGVCQGATLAKMLLCKPDVIHGYDIKANHYNPYKHLFENYAKTRDGDDKYEISIPENTFNAIIDGRRDKKKRL